MWDINSSAPWGWQWGVWRVQQSWQGMAEPADVLFQPQNCLSEKRGNAIS